MIIFSMENAFASNLTSKLLIKCIFHGKNCHMTQFTRAKIICRRTIFLKKIVRANAALTL